MYITISTKTTKKTFRSKNLITVGSNEKCNVVLDFGFDFMLTIQFNEANKSFSIINNFNTDKILFKGKPLGVQISTGEICKLQIADSEDFIGIKAFEKVVEAPEKTVVKTTSQARTLSNIAQEDFTEEDIKSIYGDDYNASARAKLEKRKSDIDKQRVAIIKEVGFEINNSRKKLNANTNTIIVAHLALIFSSIITAFGISNYIMGLPIEETTNYLHLPTNLKVWLIFSLLVFGVSLILKQGMYLFLQNKMINKKTSNGKMAEIGLLTVSSLFMIAFYAINLIYFSNGGKSMIYGVLLGLFFTGITYTLSMACGYFKYNSYDISANLDRIEYREDFEAVQNKYQNWIDMFINSLSKAKLNNIKDTVFTLNMKSIGETVLGIFTAPFLAYGVSNTLANCFPEAAGWIRFSSGLRFSPVFLVLASFMIIFAFFQFVNVFWSIRKIQGSNVIKQDGFSDYSQHGVDLYGLEGTRRIKSEITRSSIIAISIILIEFTMNVSYFAGEMGGDLQGLLLSFVSALVPTALLIAETYMLSQTKFDIHVLNSILSKIDKEV